MLIDIQRQVWGVYCVLSQQEVDDQVGQMLPTVKPVLESWHPRPASSSDSVMLNRLEIRDRVDSRLDQRPPPRGRVVP